MEGLSVKLLQLLHLLDPLPSACIVSYIMCLIF